MNKQTNGDLFFALIKEIGGPLLLEDFKQSVLPHLGRSVKWNEPLTDEQYQHGWARIREELPAFRQYLMTAELPPVPATWCPSQN